MKALKPIVACIAIAVIVIGCRGGDHSPASADKKSTPLEQRQLLIKELNRLKAGLASGDGNTVASFFSFPIPINDSVLTIYANDSTYNKDYEAAYSQLTRSVFLKHYPFIAENLQVKDFNQLFQVINTDSLLHKDTIEYEWSKDTVFCARGYSITIEDDQVTLMARTVSNPNYKEKKDTTTPVTDSATENEEMGDECDFVSRLLFRFDGTKLTFIKLTLAG